MRKPSEFIEESECIYWGIQVNLLSFWFQLNLFNSNKFVELKKILKWLKNSVLTRRPFTLVLVLMKPTILYNALLANECHFYKIGLIYHKNGCNRVKFVAILLLLRKCYSFFSSYNNKGDNWNLKLGQNWQFIEWNIFGWRKIFYLNISPSYWRLDWKISYSINEVKLNLSKHM